jgi:hypothetical protein
VDKYYFWQFVRDLLEIEHAVIFIGNDGVSAFLAGNFFVSENIETEQIIACNGNDFQISVDTNEIFEIAFVQRENPLENFRITPCIDFLTYSKTRVLSIYYFGEESESFCSRLYQKHKKIESHFEGFWKTKTQFL